MKHIKLFEEFTQESADGNIDDDFAQQQADLVGMTKEEWIAHYATPHPEEE